MKRLPKKTEPGNGTEPPDAPTPPPSAPWWRAWSRREVLAAFALLLAVLFTYQPLRHAGYIWDDDVLVTENPCVVGPLGLKEVWTTKAADLCPLTITTFWAEHKLWGLAPLPYHLVNVLMHAACAILLWRVLLVLQVPGAWLGAALWALHPLQVESAAWVAETKNTQSGIFFLLAILFFLHSLKSGGLSENTERIRPDGATVLCSALAMASKSSTVVLPVILCLLAWWVEGRWRWRRLREVAPVFLFSLVAGIVTIWTQALQPAVDVGTHLARSWPQRFVIAGDVVWFYLAKLAWPHPLMTVYPLWEINPGRWFAFLPLLAVTVVLQVLWRQRRVWGSVWLLVGAYFLVALFPVLGFAEVSSFRFSFVADHFAYLASMGPLALAGAGIVWLADHFRSAGTWCQAGAGLLLLALGLTSWHRTWAYESAETLWTDTLAKNPRCWVGYGNLGVALAQKGQLDAAVRRYREALQFGPNDAKTHDNIGDVFLREGRIDDALAEYRDATKIFPSNAGKYYTVGNLFLQEGQVDKAITQFQTAVKLNDGFFPAHSNLGAAFKLAGRIDEAIAQYEAAVRIEPHNVQNRNNLGNLYFQKGQVDKAAGQYEEAVRIDPNDAYTYRNLGNVLSQRGHLNEAVAEYQEALKINPADAETHNNLGSAFLQKGQLDAAVGQYQEAVKAEPGYAAGHRNLGLVLARKGRLPEAIAQFKEALRLQPRFSEAQHDLDTAQGLAQPAAASPVP